jgi:hypothetical protein
MTQTNVTSPLDVLNRKAAAKAAQGAPAAPEVGRLKIHFRPEPDDRPDSRQAKVTLEIPTDARPV